MSTSTTSAWTPPRPSKTQSKPSLSKASISQVKFFFSSLLPSHSLFLLISKRRRFAGIVTCVPGETNPVIECLDRLRHLETEPDQNLIAQAFNTLHELCANPNSDSNSNVAIATKNGAVELACSLCSKISLAAGSHVVPLVSALNALSSLLHGCDSFDSEFLKHYCRFAAVLNFSRD